VEDFEAFPTPRLKDLIEIVGVKLQADWRKTGLRLGLDHSVLKSIKRDFGNDDALSCMTEVFSVWHDSQTSNYSWKTLAKELCSETMNKPGLLPHMLSCLTKLYPKQEKLLLFPILLFVQSSEGNRF
jgi:hypothetical protein